MSIILSPSETFESLLSTIITSQKRYGFSQPVYVEGPPGIGKTAIVNKLGQHLSILKGKHIPVIIFIAAIADAVDVRGLPCIVDGQTCWMTPKEFMMFDEFILFFDELSNAIPQVSNAIQNLVFSRMIGNDKLSNGCIILAAGNRTSDRAGSNRLTTSLSSRFQVSYMEPSLIDFKQWGAQPVNPNLPNGDTRINWKVLAYLALRPANFHTFDPKKDGPFSCPRTLEMLSTYVYEAHPVEKIRWSKYDGCVGAGFATEFMAFESTANTCVNSTTILRDPDHAPVPEEPSALYATTTALAYVATPNNLDLITTYLGRCGDDYAVNALQIIDSRDTDRSLANTKAMTLANTKYADLYT